MISQLSALSRIVCCEHLPNIMSLPLALVWLLSFSHYPRFVIVIRGEDRNKYWLKSWQLCVEWKLPMCGNRVTKRTQYCVCFANQWVNVLLRFPPFVNTTPRCLNFSTCCSVLPFTFSLHWFGFLERKNISVIVVLNFISAWSHAAENRSHAVHWRPVEKTQAVSTCLQKVSSWSCSF